LLLAVYNIINLLFDVENNKDGIFICDKEIIFL
jgi:hypothetical protein